MRIYKPKIKRNINHVNILFEKYKIYKHNFHMYIIIFSSPNDIMSLP